VRFRRLEAAASAATATTAKKALGLVLVLQSDEEKGVNVDPVFPYAFPDVQSPAWPRRAG
jgi:hypothetical protein